MVHDHIPLLMQYLDKIESKAVREAYLYLTHHAATLRDYICRPGKHGDVDDFRYEQGTEWPFAFIINQGKGLLWYFRKAGLRHPVADVARLRECFVEVQKKKNGEITVRISNIEDAKKIASLVFGAR